VPHTNRVLEVAALGTAYGRLTDIIVVVVIISVIY
jgi:hypothetical protein